MAEGPGTAEGYRPPVDEGERRRGRLVWVRLPTAHEGPPYAYEVAEDLGAVEAADEERDVDDAGDDGQ